MVQETHTEVTSQSWGSRLGGSFKGILVGVVLVGLAGWLLFWNEGRAVRRARALTEGAGVVVSVQAGAVLPANEGQLVHLSGLAETFDVLRDEAFGVAVSAIHLERTVEMYQWREKESESTEKKLGGGTETTTTYSYEAGWSESVINSNDFKVPAGHENPNRMPHKSSKSSASEVSIGAFSLSPGLINGITHSEALTVESLDKMAGDLRPRALLVSGGIYLGRAPATPEVGDLRVSFEVVRPTTVSVIARQAGNGLEAYRTENGSSLELLSHGLVPADQMFVAAQKANRLMSWILRLVGFLMIAFGLKTILRPLSVLADVVPAIGRVMEASTGFVAYLLAGFLWLIIVAVAWLYHRPVLAVALLLVAGAVAVLSVMAISKGVKQKKEPQAAA